MSLAHDVIGSGAREAALIGVKKINAIPYTEVTNCNVITQFNCRYRLYVYLYTAVRISHVILFSPRILFVCFFFPQFIIYGKNAYSVSLCFQNVMVCISEDLFID